MTALKSAASPAFPEYTERKEDRRFESPLLSHCELKVHPAARKNEVQKRQDLTSSIRCSSGPSGNLERLLNYYRDAIEVFFSNPQRQAEPIAGHDG